MSQGIPTNPDVLKWARETRGLDVEDVVQKLARKGITSDLVCAWENGSESPSYPQLERLAYEIYKRPLAVFFFPEPPEEESVQQSFRTLPEYEIKQLPPRLRLLLRKAKVFRCNLFELHNDINPAPRQILRDLSFRPDVSAMEMASSVREYLGIDLNEQIRWENSEVALKQWRNALEDKGIFIFKDAFKLNEFSGFCLYDDSFPIVYVNNTKSKTRQTFTLFHELAHLFFQTGGIDTPIEGYVEYLEGENRRIEVLCNRFAGAFLVPDHELDQRIRNRQITGEYIQALSNIYHVSREVILRKLFDRGLFDQFYYDRKVREWAEPPKKEKPGSGNYYRNIGAYLGSKYLDTVFGQYYQSRITVEQLADYIGIKVKNFPGVEMMLMGKEATT
ncbi:MAG: ImmA/IrrE family metallo-endopeptidase [Nitrospirae bacterium]|nr:ImmA/IrrE family metallo-endopeptidase [Candidatus Manganitrophaceae bacterium]